MTVPTIPTQSGAADSSAKLLNSNTNSENTSGGLSFNAAMNETASDYKFDDQHYMLANGQVLTAEQLLEMLENGNSLPGMNLPSLAELQQFKFQAGLNNQKLMPVESSKINDFQLDSTTKMINAKLPLNQQVFMEQQFNLNTNSGNSSTNPEQLLVSINTLNSTTNGSPDSTLNGFTAVQGYQITSGASGTNGIMSSIFGINTPVQHPQWNQSLGQSVQWMVNQNIQQAEIKLNPPDLGMLDIRIAINNDNATVNFTAANSAVREALESAMPRLRDMLEESGISLADVNVSEHSLEQEQEKQELNMDESSGNATSDDDLNSELSGTTENASRLMKLGLLDIYA